MLAYLYWMLHATSEHLAIWEQWTKMDGKQLSGLLKFIYNRGFTITAILANHEILIPKENTSFKTLYQYLLFYKFTLVLDGQVSIIIKSLHLIAKLYHTKILKWKRKWRICCMGSFVYKSVFLSVVKISSFKLHHYL